MSKAAISFAFLVAARQGHTSIGQRLLETGRVDVNWTEGHGWTALICASISNNIEIVKELLCREVNVNVADIEGQTALMVAS